MTLNRRRVDRQRRAAAVTLSVAAHGLAVFLRQPVFAAMLEPGRRPQRAQLQAQQEFIEAHCTAPVR